MSTIRAHDISVDGFDFMDMSDLQAQLSKWKQMWRVEMDREREMRSEVDLAYYRESEVLAEQKAGQKIFREGGILPSITSLGGQLHPTKWSSSTKMDSAGQGGARAGFGTAAVGCLGLGGPGVGKTVGSGILMTAARAHVQAVRRGSGTRLSSATNNSSSGSSTASASTELNIPSQMMLRRRLLMGNGSSSSSSDNSSSSSSGGGGGGPLAMAGAVVLSGRGSRRLDEEASKMLKLGNRFQLRGIKKVFVSLWASDDLSLLQWRLAGSKSHRPDGIIPVSEILQVVPLVKQKWFSLKTADRTLTLEAGSPAIRDKWVPCLRTLIAG